MTFLFSWSLFWHYTLIYDVALNVERRSLIQQASASSLNRRQHKDIEHALSPSALFAAITCNNTTVRNRPLCRLIVIYRTKTAQKQTTSELVSSRAKRCRVITCLQTIVRCFQYVRKLVIRKCDRADCHCCKIRLLLELFQIADMIDGRRPIKPPASGRKMRNSIG